MSTAKKDTVYIEADDEITTVIDKVTTSKEKVVAVVLPKRATVFQSAVNMKLLKKASENENKNIVLITSDASLNAIAAVSGVHIAKSLSSKPEIPKKPKPVNNETTITEDELEIDDGKATAVGAAAGTAVGAAAVASKINIDQSAKNQSDTIQMDNTTPVSTGSTKSSKGSSIPNSTKSGKKKKILAIPDFSSFRTRTGIGIGVILLIILGWFIGFRVMPKSTVTMNTDSANIEVSTDFTAIVGLSESDIEMRLLSAEKAEFPKESTATVPSTGQVDKGEKASGFVTLTNCNAGAVTIKTGTTFTKDGKNFVTTEAVSLDAGVLQGGECKSGQLDGDGTVGDADVAAESAGDSFNVSEGNFSSSVGGVSAFGSNMTGGTSNIVKVVSAEDINNAKGKLAGENAPEAIENLKKSLQDKNQQALVETLQQNEGAIQLSANVGDEVGEVTATGVTTYIMLGVEADDISQVLNKKVDEELGDQEKNIRSNGYENAVYNLIDKKSDDQQTIGLKTVATTGPDFDEDKIKKDIAGQKRGDVEKILEELDGVRSVNVEFSPFWIFKVPSNPDKVTIIINETEN